MPAYYKKASGERGHAHHGWLKTFHHFPFASYYDPSNRFQDFGALRVVNEDRVIPSEGFGTHGHAEYEIFSYIVDGELEHRDSLGNLEIMKRGEIQMTSTGTGIRHSEYNRNSEKEVHFLQCWAKPFTARLPPNYYNRHFTDEEKLNKIVRVVAPIGDEGVVDEREGKGPIPIHAHVRVAASILTPSSTVSHQIRDDTTKTLVHNTMRSGYRGPREKSSTGGSKLTVTSGTEKIELDEGDSLYITGTVAEPVKVESVGGRDAEFLIFEML